MLTMLAHWLLLVSAYKKAIFTRKMAFLSTVFLVDIIQNC
ncbi:MAG: hypothetical protein K0S31_3089 [Sphingobacterium multivorum]|jgi:hypothetical protein|nr:hypothetical protein [Sphingobacterium multivorum]